MEIKQYEIVLVNLDPTIGSEIKKTRPCAVISPNEMNKYLQTIVVAPLTSSSKPYPTRVEIKQAKTKGWIVLDQIRTVDRKRIFKKLGTLTKIEIEAVKNVIMETYVE
ncbi:MAG TPA: type II toxin-antitoxin system PemK/MazF family toxin [Chitinophagales bacterium]|nr:type II toxin-antitoxin system PemK/MazF family toxin [Chitinophagales bacterium]MCB9074523.1 type II toxin-antitoxin system PemK/MazF family toxin [Chitinophagales bacterium]HMU99276.1 type II toxin-antitoxin system PemK/MazF family toxin [Chitinophagales bacterium]HMV01844.1 type II toxin-antitoxin system PemK/MazF family toxin [Chitinophagales bacterium]HMW93722.1 type II toxin-antitoxin system PemK/MazF family toxin [Chitinophagales bacterium]